jgi:hypothetical protein
MHPDDHPTALPLDTLDWTVKRHAGHSHAIWRTLFTGSYDKAYSRFHNEWAKVRQGSVALFRPDGSIALKESVPPKQIDERGRLLRRDSEAYPC